MVIKLKEMVINLKEMVINSTEMSNIQNVDDKSEKRTFISIHN